MMKSFEKKLLSEFLGTFLFVTLGCGTALFAMSLVGYIGIALAFGLTLAAIYTIFGKFSGAHVNPAVSFGFFMAKKMDFKTFLSYALAQLIGGLAAAGTLLVIYKSLLHCGNIQSFATNGYGMSSPAHFGLWGCAAVEILTTFMLVMTYFSRDGEKNTSTFSLAAVLIAAHFVSLPVTGASLNPARSFGMAVVEGGTALSQVWFFFVMPMVGAFLASLVHGFFNKK